MIKLKVKTISEKPTLFRYRETTSELNSSLPSSTDGFIPQAYLPPRQDAQFTNIPLSFLSLIHSPLQITATIFRTHTSHTSLSPSLKSSVSGERAP